MSREKKRRPLTFWCGAALTSWVLVSRPSFWVALLSHPPSRPPSLPPSLPLLCGAAWLPLSFHLLGFSMLKHCTVLPRHCTTAGANRLRWSRGRGTHANASRAGANLSLEETQQNPKKKKTASSPHSLTSWAHHRGPSRPHAMPPQGSLAHVLQRLVL